MLPPDYLDHAPDALVKLWQEVEDAILRDVARRIGKTGKLTPTANWQLWRYQQTEAVRQEVIRLLAKYSGKSEAEIRRLMQEAATASLENEDEIYYHYGKQPTPFEDSVPLQNLLNEGYLQTAGTFSNLTATTANTVAGQFEQTLDKAWLQVSSGAFDYKTAVKSAVDTLADDMKYVTYPSGHKDTLEVACRRAVLTGVNQTGGKLQEARMDEMGVQFVETTAHGGARPSHAEWQGRQFHRGGAVDYMGRHYPDFYTATGYGTGGGIYGWNCRHSHFPIFPELGSPPTWTREQLEQLNARDIEYDGQLYTRYEISQMQRARERAVRKWKRRYLAETESGVDATQSAVRLRAARAELTDFTARTGGRADSARTSVHGFGRSEASRASHAARDYEKRQKDAIIIENLRTAAKLPKAAVIHLKPTSIDIDSLTFDDAHINQERSHRVSEEQAKQYIRDARISVTVWNGQFERYYGADGSAYVNMVKNEIRTTYSRDQYDENTTALIEEMKKNGILG